MRSYIETWKKIFGIKRAKRIFVAATRQNTGKTTMSLGIIAVLKKHFNNIGFIKPVGQRYLLESGYKVDEDSVLIEHVYGMHDGGCELKDMSPIAVEKGFTEKLELTSRSTTEVEILTSREESDLSNQSNTL